MATQILTAFQLSTPKTAYLSLVTGEQTHFYSINNFVSIGRGRSNEITIPDKYSSLSHCRIDRLTGNEIDQFVLRDLNSSNGTQLNGTTIKEAPLTHLDKVTIGETQFTFSYTDQNKSNRLKIKSRNEAWNNKLAQIPTLSASEAPVLLNGPTGSGKEVMAHHIHNFSPRSDAPFVSINCSALSENLVESELFGHVKGGFTDASHDRPGAFRAAHGGTLFLDEVGDLPLNLQPKLLRAIENCEVKPVGSDTVVKTDVRIITATHHDLKRAIAQGRFRSDLFYRIHVVTIDIPPLIARKEDFEDLLFRMAKEYRVRFSVAAIGKLKQHEWPGNIRELKNMVLRASALFPHTLIEIKHLRQLLESIPTKSVPYFKEQSPIKEFEKQLICDELVAHKGNQRKVSINLGMAKSTLHDKIKAYNISIDELLGKFDEESL